MPNGEFLMVQNGESYQRWYKWENWKEFDSLSWSWKYIMKNLDESNSDQKEDGILIN